MRPKQRALVVAQMPLIAAQNATLFEDGAGILEPGRIEAFHIPVLLLRGEKSPPITAIVNAELADRFPNATEVMVNGAGHMAPITHESDIAAQVKAFLSEG